MYSNKPSLLNSVNPKIIFIIHACVYAKSYARSQQREATLFFQIIKDFAISLNLKNIL